jgi:hypothetical protein
VGVGGGGVALQEWSCVPAQLSAQLLKHMRGETLRLCPVNLPRLQLRFDDVCGARKQIVWGGARGWWGRDALLLVHPN